MEAVRLDFAARGVHAGNVDRFTPTVMYIRVLVDPTLESTGITRGESDAKRLRKNVGYSLLSVDHWTAATEFVSAMQAGTWLMHEEGVQRHDE